MPKTRKKKKLKRKVQYENNNKGLVILLPFLRLKQRDTRVLQSSSMENAGVDQTARILTQSTARHQNALRKPRW